MTQEEKQLLLKDLCARLPYGVKCKITSIKKYEIKTLFPEQVGVFKRNNCNIYPYLRPIHKLTKEELEELEFLTDSDYVDYCNKHHLDYRNLISKGLALEAPEDMYKTELI